MIIKFNETQVLIFRFLTSSTVGYFSPLFGCPECPVAKIHVVSLSSTHVLFRLIFLIDWSCQRTEIIFPSEHFSNLLTNHSEFLSEMLWYYQSHKIATNDFFVLQCSLLCIALLVSHLFPGSKSVCIFPRSIIQIQTWKIIGVENASFTIAASIVLIQSKQVDRPKD